jgi:hypothetical protein
MTGWLATLALLSAGHALAAEPLGTEFTYQGQLKSGGVPVNGNYDMKFELFDQPADGTLIGTLIFDGDLISQNPPPVLIANGLFTVELDFGAGVFTGGGRWLQISVHRHMTPGSYERLSPPQPVTSAPYALYALDGPGSGGYWTLNGSSIYNNNGGYVGVGTSNPQYNLHIRKDGFSGPNIPPARLGIQRFLGVMPPGTSLNDWFAIEVGGDGIGWGPNTRLVRESGTSLHFQTEDTINSVIRPTQMTLDANGRLGIGTMSPKENLHVNGDYYGRGHVYLYAYQGDGASGTAYLQARDDSGTSSIDLQIRAQNAGTVLDVARFRADGTTQVKVIEIAGADVAEKFPVSEEVEPGMVVAIDPKRPGQLCLARGAYNRCVAGVVSGANNLPAGAVLGNLPGHEDAPPIALTGRVWVQSDATQHPIEPGNLLTTADTPGHAMKVIDFGKAQGAIIGKAMTSLEEGRGLVLVLVSLQ